MGYHQGLMDFSREPAKKKANILAGILQEMVRDERNEISSVTEGSQRVSQHRPQSSGGDHDDDPASSWRNARLARRVAAVGEKIVRTGREIVHQKVAEVAEPTLGGESDDNDGLEVDHEGLMDRIGICRETKDEIKWTFYLIDTSIPNAFVSELMPHSIFVTTAMMDLFIENDDELALVLGHEISHLILGHTSDMNRFQSRLAALEILLLSLDPTEGLFSIFCMACVAYIKKAIAASHSRDSERAADQLGIRIAAMSCFDTGRAATVFRKMALKKNQGETELKANVDQEQVAETTHFTDTHPPSMERYMNIKSMSKDENADKYRNTHCAEAKRSFMDAMRLYQYNRLRIKPVIQ